MTAPLIRPTILSIYKVNGHQVTMPERMARSTPDLKHALYAIREKLRASGGELVLSDLFRSYEMQLQAHVDYTSGKKKAFSPAPGRSMHESGRAFDFDLKSARVTLPAFWEITRGVGVVPIIPEPDVKFLEYWHFECRGSHQLVYDYYLAGKGKNFNRPAEAMAASAIISAGLPHDRFRDTQQAAFIQSAMIRLGHDVGNMDGQVGPKTLGKLGDLAIKSLVEVAAALDMSLQEQFPNEYFDQIGDVGAALI